MSIRNLEGPNVYSYRPVLKVTLSIGQYEWIASNGIPGFIAGLLALLPGLYNHNCSRGRPGGLVERLYEGTYLAHIFEHVVLELQFMAGEEYAARFGKTRRADQPGVYDVVIGYKSLTAVMTAVQKTEELLTELLNHSPVKVDRLVEKIRLAGENGKLGISTQAIYDAARRRGIPCRRVDSDANMLILGYGIKQERVWAAATSRTSSVAVDLVCDKQLTKELLSQHGIPVPFGYAVDNYKAALQAFQSIGGPVAVKPVAGNHGRGVSLQVSQPQELERAFTFAGEHDKRVIVEEFIAGKQYRLCVVNGKLVACAERIPACVTGDGVRTIKKLVDIVNQDSVRGEGHTKELTKLRLDATSIGVLARHNMTPDTVPDCGQTVYIRDNANLSAGATAVDVTDQVHPETVYLAERIARLVDLDIAGIDIVVQDIGKPLVAGEGAVIEVNAAPGLRMHLYPAAGKPRDVGAEIVNYLFPNGTDGCIPIVAITGTNGKTTVTRLIGHIFGQMGKNVGMTTSEGIFVGGRKILCGDTTGPDSARMVLSDAAVELAVLEVARGGIVRGGLGYDQADVSVITNITEDHLGQDGIEDLEDLAHIKSLLVETVKPDGTALLNADDSRAAALAARARGEIFYFSTQPDNILVRRHLGAGGRAAFVREGIVYIAAGALALPVIRIEDIPLTLGGIALHNVENCIIAAAACYAGKVPVGVIRRGLGNFLDNPGRLTLVELGEFRVCVDYAHNPAGYQALINTVRQLGAKRLVGVIAAPGDRRDDAILSVGRIAGQGFDYLYVKEDQDLRGRKPGETAALLRKGAIENGIAPERIKTILPEKEAVACAVRDAQPDDLVVIMYEKYDVVMAAIEEYGKLGGRSANFSPPGVKGKAGKSPALLTGVTIKG